MIIWRERPGGWTGSATIEREGYMKKISDRMILTQLDAKIIASVKAHLGGLFVLIKRAIF